MPLRLGYACLNTVLRKQKPPVFCSRTCRLETLKQKGLDHAKDLGRQNVLDLAKLVQWNEEHGIKFMRMSSEMFPFASHKDWTYDLSYCKDELKAVGDLAKKLGHRLTMHPGQFNQLGSNKDNVIESTVRDLKYHSQILDYMGLDKHSVMILHMGGTYGDRDSAIARWEENFQKLDKNIADRIVLENDEISYCVEQILPTCKRLNIPLVFDWHHHSINPGTVPLDEMLPQIAETWTRRGIRQKQHYSESRLGAETPMERRAHSDRVKSIPNKLDEEVDLMLEAKDKEQAVLTIYKQLGMCEVADGVIWDPLPETKRVVDRTRKPKAEGDAPKKKRVSRKKKASKDSDDDASDEEVKKPKKRASRKKVVKKEESDSDEISDEEVIKPKKRVTRKRKVVKKEESDSEETSDVGSSDVSEDDAPKKRKSSAKKAVAEKKSKRSSKKESSPETSAKTRSKTASAKKMHVEEESEVEELIVDE